MCFLFILVTAKPHMCHIIVMEHPVDLVVFPLKYPNPGLRNIDSIMVECLPSICRALCSISSMSQIK